MGGRGQSSGKVAGGIKEKTDKFVKEIVGVGMPRGDLQGVVEAFAMTNKLSFMEGDAILGEIDKFNDFIYGKAELTSEALKSARVQKEIKEFAKKNNVSTKFLNQKIKKASDEMDLPF